MLTATPIPTISPVPIGAIDILKRALRYLAAQDGDGATERNARGFSGRDTQPGHRLAENLHRWRPDGVLRAHAIACRYAATQLAAAGITVPSAADVAATCADAAALALSNALATVRVYAQDGMIAVSSEYHPALVAVCRAIRAKYNSLPYDRIRCGWLFPMAAYYVVLAAFPYPYARWNEDLILDPDDTAPSSSLTSDDNKDDERSYSLDAADRYEDYDGGRYDY